MACNDHPCDDITLMRQGCGCSRARKISASSLEAGDGTRRRATDRTLTPNVLIVDVMDAWPQRPEVTPASRPAVHPARAYHALHV